MYLMSHTAVVLNERIRISMLSNLSTFFSLSLLACNKLY